MYAWHGIKWVNTDRGVKHMASEIYEVTEEKESKVKDFFKKLSLGILNFIAYLLIFIMGLLVGVLFMLFAGDKL